MQESTDGESLPDIEYYADGGDIGQVQEARTRLGRVEEVRHVTHLLLLQDTGEKKNH
jgi:hypothetical protein